MVQDTAGNTQGSEQHADTHLLQVHDVDSPCETEGQDLFSIIIYTSHYAAADNGLVIFILCITGYDSSEHRKSDYIPQTVTVIYNLSPYDRPVLACLADRIFSGACASCGCYTDLHGHRAHLVSLC